jgi:hypothetical protein
MDDLLYALEVLESVAVFAYLWAVLLVLTNNGPNYPWPSLLPPLLTVTIALLATAALRLAIHHTPRHTNHTAH